MVGKLGSKYPRSAWWCSALCIGFTCNGRETGFNISWLSMAALLQLSVNLNLIHYSPTANLQYYEFIYV